MRKSSRIIKYQNSEKYQKQLSAEKKDTLFVYNTQHNNIFFLYTLYFLSPTVNTRMLYMYICTGI